MSDSARDFPGESTESLIPQGLAPVQQQSGYAPHRGPSLQPCWYRVYFKRRGVCVVACPDEHPTTTPTPGCPLCCGMDGRSSIPRRTSASNVSSVSPSFHLYSRRQQHGARGVTMAAAFRARASTVARPSARRFPRSGPPQVGTTPCIHAYRRPAETVSRTSTKLLVEQT